MKRLEFPSPYGVSFILILFIYILKGRCLYGKFPSPYGVSFILIISFILF